MYVDDIIMTENDNFGIGNLNEYSHKNFTKDLGPFKYFIGVEVVRSKKGLCIFQRKYTLDILSETCLLEAKLVDNPMDADNKIMHNQEELLSDPS